MVGTAALSKKDDDPPVNRCEYVLYNGAKVKSRRRGQIVMNQRVGSIIKIEDLKAGAPVSCSTYYVAGTPNRKDQGGNLQERSTTFSDR